MKPWIRIGQITSLGLVLSIGCLVSSTLNSFWLLNFKSFSKFFLLFGWPMIVGVFTMVIISSPSLMKNSIAVLVSNSIALFSNFWLILWCFSWLGILDKASGSMKVVIQSWSYLHLFGVGIAMFSYVFGFSFKSFEKKIFQYLSSSAWTVAYVSWVNLFFDQKLICDWFLRLSAILLWICLIVLRKKQKDLSFQKS
jgi:hypothetical protein